MILVAQALRPKMNKWKLIKLWIFDGEMRKIEEWSGGERQN